MPRGPTPSGSALGRGGHVHSTPCCSTTYRAAASRSTTSHRVVRSCSAREQPESARRHQPPHNVSCHATAVEVISTTAVLSGVAQAGLEGAFETPSAKTLPVDNVDVAVIGADVAGFAAALAASRALPGARVVLYDTAMEPPPARDGGVLLSVNGLRALQALDPALYSRLTTDLSSSVHEALWFDMEGDLVRRSVLGQSAPALASSPGAPAGRRRASRRRGGPAPAPAGPASSPDADAPPLMVGLHELRDALLDALPQEVEIYGRHHVHSLQEGPELGMGAGGGGGGGTLVRFAPSPTAPPVRSARARLVIGADGADSMVRRLQFDSPAEPQPTGRVVWRGRLTLRPRDPDMARLRNFTTASRTWVDLRAAPGSERHASLSPAGPNTFVWSASCPVGLLEGRGLREAAGQASPYWRCVAMFEDFPPDFFAALRATTASAVVERSAARAPAASLKAPWRWFNGGGAALVGDAVHLTPADDAASSGINLALEDAAVLGACVRQHGTAPRALQEYARQRGPRVSELLSAATPAAERQRLRDAPFLPPPPTAVTAVAPAVPLLEGVAAAPTSNVAAVAASTAAVAGTDASASAPAPPLAAVLAAAVAEAAGEDSAPAEVPSPASAPSVPELSRPSGGSRRSVSPAPTEPAAAPSSPLFSRPSGARRWGPIPWGPAALAAVAHMIAAAHPRHAAAAAAATAAAAAAASPPYDPATAPHAVWRALLTTPGGAQPADACSLPVAAPGAPAAVASPRPPPRQYCSLETPASVWQALLVPYAHAALASLPYDAAASPSLVWTALLGAARATAATAAAGPAAARVTAATAPPRGGAPAASATASPQALLPKPVPRPKLAAPAPALAPAAALAAPNGAPLPPPKAPLPTAAPSQHALQHTAPAAAAAAPARSSRADRRPHAGSHSPAPHEPAAASRRSGRPAALAAASKPARRTGGRGAAAAKAARTAATVTLTAAALGGVISSGGHVHADVMHSAVYGAVHVHSSVAQFWEDMNNLASASLSSMDV